MPPSPAAADAPVVLTLVERLKGAAARRLGFWPMWAQRALLRRRPIVLDGQTLATDLQLLLAAMTEDERIFGGSPDELRSRQRRAAAMLIGQPVAVAAVRDFALAAGSGPPLRARHYAPPSPERTPLVVFFHGGGFVFGDLDTHDQLCRMLCRHAGLHVLAVDYRLAPEHPFPVAVEDALRAYRWARAHAGELGADTARLVVCGDSAGANLSAAVAQLTAGMPEAPTAQLLLYPATDHEGDYPSKHLFAEGFLLTREATRWYHEQYVGSSTAPAGDPRVRVLAGQLVGLAPALVVTAGFDPLRDEGEAYAARLRANGSAATTWRFESLIHGFANLTSVSRSSYDAVVAVALELRRMLGLAPLPGGRAAAEPRARATCRPARSRPRRR